MARKRKAQTEIVPDEVPPAPTQEAQNTPNETPLKNQDAEAAVEPTVRPSKSKVTKLKFILTFSLKFRKICVSLKIC
jgi:hypothetical protein